MAPIPELPYDEIKTRVTECIHPARSIAQADIYALTWEGAEVLLKDFSGRPWWIRKLWAPLVLGREFRALRRLRGVNGIPELLGRAGPCAILIERLQARRLPRNKDEDKSPPEFFDRAADLLRELHERGIAHGDLRRLNILTDDRHRPYLIDFATSVTAKPGFGGSISRFFFRRIALIDRITLARIKSEFYPDRLTEQERQILEHPPWYLRLGRLLKKRVYRLRKARHRRRLVKRIHKRILGESKK